jgi:hypothetical protein
VVALAAKIRAAGVPATAASKLSTDAKSTPRTGYSASRIGIASRLVRGVRPLREGARSSVREGYSRAKRDRGSNWSPLAAGGCSAAVVAHARDAPRTDGGVAPVLAGHAAAPDVFAAHRATPQARHVARADAPARHQ